jgi:hypothetical protein
MMSELNSKLSCSKVRRCIDDCKLQNAEHCSRTLAILPCTWFSCTLDGYKLPLGVDEVYFHRNTWLVSYYASCVGVLKLSAEEMHGHPTCGSSAAIG